MSKKPYETQDIPVKAVAIGGLIFVIIVAIHEQFLYLKDDGGEHGAHRLLARDRDQRRVVRHPLVHRATRLERARRVPRRASRFS